MIPGLDELYRRIDAAASSSLAIGEAWAQSAATIAEAIVPVRSGETRRSIRIRSVDPGRATIEAGAAAVLIEGGQREHPIEARGNALRFQGSGRTIFAKRVNHPRVPPRPFMTTAAQSALDRLDADRIVVDRWNGAGR